MKTHLHHCHEPLPVGLLGGSKTITNAHDNSTPNYRCKQLLAGWKWGATTTTTQEHDYNNNNIETAGQEHRNREGQTTMRMRMVTGMM